jgi:thiol-disulfide isomerase/thioredoxin
MKMPKNFTRVVVLMLCLLVLGANVLAEAPAKGGINATYQFYNSSNFAHLTDPDPVFRSMSYDQMIKLFESEGTYMVLFGGAWCPNTQAVISQINDVAKEYGVTTIYNFDFKLDNATFHIRDTKNAYANLYVDMVLKYLPNIVTLYDKNVNGVSYVNAAGETLLTNKLQVPFLFLYNKDSVGANGKPAPILASYEKMLKWEADFQTNGVDDPAKIEAYKKEIRPLFDLVSTKSILGKKTAKLDTFTDFEYYSTSFNAKAKTTILDAKDEPWVMQTVSYFELIKILESPGNFVFMFGGPWCGNTQAVIKMVNEYAKKYNITAIYTWDTKLDSNILQIRDTKNAYAKLYVDLVRKYFPGIETVYALDKNNVQYTDAAGNIIAANKLQVPYVFVYNKDRKDASGNPDPILGQIEYMYSWENIQPGYVDKNGAVGVNYKNYTAALDALFGQLAAIAK